MSDAVPMNTSTRYPCRHEARKRPLWELWIALALLFCGLNAALAQAQNPFTGKPSPVEEKETRAGSNGILEKIALWQQKIRAHMADQMTIVRTEHTMRPLLLLISLAFGYGALHAAGPGHGKAVALSYMLTRRRKAVDAAFFGSTVALFHGLSGIVFVLLVKLVLQKSVNATLAEMTHITQVVSFSLITGLGGFLFVQGLVAWIKHAQPAIEAHHHFFKRQKGPLATALLLGMIPCPGVVMVMLFALSLDLAGLGILLGVAIALGMAVTVATVVLIAVAGKKLTTGFAAGHRDWHHHLEHAVQSAAGLAVALLGGLFLAAVIAN
jgi:nickel/cobalt transporter (NicO) family protein